jgi:hypothetical protein
MAGRTNRITESANKSRTTLYAGIAAMSVLLLAGIVFAQQSPQPRYRNVIQVSGLVVTGDSLAPIPFTTVWVKNTRRGTITDYYGFFSIAVYERDTLRFSSVGFRDFEFVVPDTLTQNRYSAIQVMTRDTIYLAETLIYPWPTREQFRHAFIHTEIPDDDYDRAMRNLARAEMKDRMRHMPMDGSMNFRHLMNQQANRLYYAGQAPPIRIFDPLAWGQFIQAWREGRFKQSD